MADLGYGLVNVDVLQEFVVVIEKYTAPRTTS